VDRVPRLKPGPARKSQAWRAGALFLGWAVILILIAVLPFPFEFSVGWLVVALALGGLALSIPFGLSWLRGEEPAELPRDPVPVRVTDVPTGQPGATYVVVASSLPRALRYKELHPFWYFLGAIFWRGPMALGDWLLTGLWNLIARVLNRTDDSYRPGGLSSELTQQEHPTEESRPREW
jgi:hypothetical protein